MGEAVRRQGPSQQRSSADDAAAADTGAVEQHAIGAEPHVVANQNATAAWLEPLVADQPVGIREGMIRGSQRAVRGNQHIAADTDAVSGIENATGVDHRAPPDDDITLAAGRLYFDECIDHHIVLDHNACSSTRVLDVGKRRDAGR